LINLKILNI